MPEPRWLSAEEQRVWRGYLTATRLIASQLDRELQRDSGIPHTYYEILVRLSEAPDRVMRMSDLAEASDSSRSRLSHAVARLEEAGWVRRTTCPTDRRGSFAVLTDAGFTITDIDTSAADVLVQTSKELDAEDVTLVFAELKDPVRRKLQRFDVLPTFAADRFHPTIEAAVAAFAQVPRPREPQPTPAEPPAERRPDQQGSER